MSEHTLCHTLNPGFQSHPWFEDMYKYMNQKGMAAVLSSRCQQARKYTSEGSIPGFDTQGRTSTEIQKMVISYPINRSDVLIKI